VALNNAIKEGLSCKGKDGIIYELHAYHHLSWSLLNNTAVDISNFENLQHYSNCGRKQNGFH